MALSLLSEAMAASMLETHSQLRNAKVMNNLLDELEMAQARQGSGGILQ